MAPANPRRWEPRRESADTCVGEQGTSYFGVFRTTQFGLDNVIKRSRGGSDFDLDRLVALCRACHDQTDAPLAAGRLIVTPMGEGRFAFDVIHGPAKYQLPSRLLVEPRR
jgi:hypothetical protein